MQHVHTLTRDAKSGVLVFFEGGGGSKVSSVGGVVVDLVSTSVFIGIGRGLDRGFDAEDFFRWVCWCSLDTTLTVLLPNFHRFTLDTSKGPEQYVCMFERFYVPNWLYL